MRSNYWVIGYWSKGYVDPNYWPKGTPGVEGGGGYKPGFWARLHREDEEILLI